MPLVSLLFAWPVLAADQTVVCGMRPDDWCAAPASDPCGVHRTVAACRADKACFGLPYRGESIVRCSRDERGFGINCPTVGCTSVAPR